MIRENANSEILRQKDQKEMSEDDANLFEIFKEGEKVNQFNSPQDEIKWKNRLNHPEEKGIKGAVISINIEKKGFIFFLIVLFLSVLFMIFHLNLTNILGLVCFILMTFWMMRKFDFSFSEEKNLAFHNFMVTSKVLIKNFSLTEFLFRHRSTIQYWFTIFLAIYLLLLSLIPIFYFLKAFFCFFLAIYLFSLFSSFIQYELDRTIFYGIIMNGCMSINILLTSFFTGTFSYGMTLVTMILWFLLSHLQKWEIHEPIRPRNIQERIKQNRV